MSDEQRPTSIRTRIWQEEPEPDNPFATRAAYCHGYDVYGEMLGNARWVEMLYLLFRGDAPSPAQADMLEVLALALANAGPRDPAVHAAMCGGVGGSPAAASLMAAIAVGAGNLGGAREVFLAMEAWRDCGRDIVAWARWLNSPEPQSASIWPIIEHPPGFDPHGVSTPTTVAKTLRLLARFEPAANLAWLSANLGAVEEIAERPLSLTGVAAAAFVDLGFSSDQGEMLFMLLRLPGAAAHALEQREYGHKKFPFYRIELENDPAAAAT